MEGALMKSDLLDQLSILIVTFQGDALLQNCLESLSNDCGLKPEIIVVDNSATTLTRALVGKYANTRYIASTENLGFAGGNNLGISSCTRPYVLLLNNDTIIHKEPFTQLIQYLIDHPHVGVVQGTMNLPNHGNTLDACGVLLTSSGEQYIRLEHRPTATTKRPNRAVFAAKGACLLFRRSIIKDLDGVLFYDHFQAYYEESNFCHRVWLSGHEVHFVDTPPIDHLLGQTAKKFPAETIQIQYISNLLFSHLTLLSTCGRWLLIPRLLLLHGIVFASSVLRRNWRSALVLPRAIKQTFLNRRRIMEVRKKIQATRTITDRELFRKVLVRPPLRYYYLLLRGRVDEFTGNFE